MNRIHTIPALLAAAALLAAPGCNKRSSLTETGDAGDTAAASDDATSDDATSGGDASTSGGDGDTGMDTASDASDSDSDAEGTGDDCGTFLGCMDVPEVDGFNCDLWQEDCEQGEKCAAVPWYRDGIYEGWQCLPAGSTEPGSPCSGVEGEPFGTDTCDADSICLGALEPGETSVCVEQCVGSRANASCPVTGHACMQLNDASLNLCLPECDPFAANACQDGWSCRPGVEGAALTRMVCYPDGGAAPAGAPCGAQAGGADVCGPGLMCAPGDFFSAAGCPDDPSQPCCTPYCSLADPGGACPVPGQQCLPLFDAATHPQYATLGACLESVTPTGEPWKDILYGY